MPLLTAKEDYIKVNGLNIRYCVAGSGEPLLLIHGLGAMMEYWYQNIPVLAEKYQVIALDLPGFGKSEAPTDYSIEYYASFINTFLETLNIEQTFVVAHSLGGALALRFAAMHRHRVNKLALLSNVGFASELNWMFRLLTLPGAFLLLRNLSRKDYAATLRSNVANPASVSETFIDVAYEMAKQPDVQRVLLKIVGMNASLLGIKSKSLASIQAGFSALVDLPMQIYWGKQDPVLPFAPHTEAAQRFFPKVPIIALDDCGHIPQIEKSDLINQGILQFLA